MKLKLYRRASSENILGLSDLRRNRIGAERVSWWCSSFARH